MVDSELDHDRRVDRHLALAHHRVQDMTRPCYMHRKSAVVVVDFYYTPCGNVARYHKELYT